MTTRYYFIEPVGVLMLRGNRSFGADGEHGEALLPPWPSLFAGAFRSALLAGDARHLAAFTAIASGGFADESQRGERMRELLGAPLFATLGTPQQPGTFRIAWASLAIRRDEAVQPVLPLPADLVALEDAEATHLAALQPRALPAGLSGSTCLPMTASMRCAKQVKPAEGHWLAGDGLTAHLSGNPPAGTLRTEALYQRETRLGIALDAASRSASDGALYTTEAVSFLEDAGFLVGIDGAGSLADEGLLRLGGDGHAARWRRADFARPAAPTVVQGGRFRLLLATPGVFSGGWLPACVTREADDVVRLRGEGFTARLACAALPRHAVVSGWDLAQWAPKTAQRVASTGSVYWFDQFEGDAGKLAAWAAGGLWPDNAAMPLEPAQRRAEGFNNALIGQWR
ncbi:MAG: type III-B CRISPR module-associated Cmr3 family protein [Rubrivivax sp.]